MKSNAYIFISLSLIICCNPLISSAYDDKLTHPHIMRKVLEGTQLNSFLQQNFNLPGYYSQWGPDTQLGVKSVSGIMQEGSTLEDDPDCRAANHFHNPIIPGSWYNGRLTDTWGPINEFCWLEDEYPPDSIVSNITWATGYQSLDPTDPAQRDLKAIDQNDWDWDSAREYYFTAITGMDTQKKIVAPNKQSMDWYLEKSLRAIGQTAHLLQDTSVPAHVRNDFSQGHIMYLPFSASYKSFWRGNAFEAYLRRNDKNADKNFWNNPPIRLQHQAFRLTDLWDTDQFNAEFNGSNVSMGTFGLSEYANLNFLSEFTMFTENFPFPKVENTTLRYDDPNTGTLFQRQYVGTTNDHPGEKIDHLAAVSYLYYYRNVYFPQHSKHIPLFLDSKCYDDYASHLIPRAIGFTADLINYFFRGRMEILPIHPQDLIIRGNGSGGISIFNITASVRNATMDPDANNNPSYTNEDMGGGTLLAVAKYQVSGSPDYSVSKGISIDSASSSKIDASAFTEFKFDFSDKPIPWNASGVDIQVIFRGTLGNEKDIAVAVGRRPLFDGTIAVTPPSEYVYSIIDASPFYNSGVAQPQSFKTLKISLRNTTAAKEIQAGTLTAIASYRRLKNYQPDLAGTSPTLSSDREETVSYSVSQPIAIGPNANPVNSTSATEFIFDFSNAPIPAGITDLYLYTVFEGTLHDSNTNTDKPDARVVGIKDLNEPQHLTYWNDADYFLLRGYPRKAEDIRNDPDVIIYGLFIDPHSISQSVKFFSINNAEPAQELVSFALQAGQYSRIIVLTDTPDTYSVADTLLAPANPVVPPQGFVYNYEFARAINQLNSDDLWHSSAILTARGVSQHDRSYYINVWPEFRFYESVPAPDNDLVPVGASSINFPQP